jgi:hypothetical protein
MFDWRWIAALAAVTLAFRLVRPILGFVLAPQIGAKALAAQPDTIHLEPGAGAAWSDPAARDRLTAELVALGFADAGTFTIRELPPVRVRLFAHGPESLLAVVFEHPQRGTWFELACRCTDGTAVTWSTLPATGLEPRPGHPVHHLPRASVDAVWKTALRGRPAQPLQPASVSSVGPDFERAWAEGMAWRKQHGVSRLEVARVGVNAGGRKAA